MDPHFFFIQVDAYCFRCFFSIRQTSTSLPVSPAAVRREISPAYPNNWPQRRCLVSDRLPQCCTVVTMSYLDNLRLPYADDSVTSTPTSTELCNFRNAVNLLPVCGGGGGRRLVSISNEVAGRRRSASKDRGGCETHYLRKDAQGGRWATNQFLPRTSVSRSRERKCEPTHFHWNTVKVKPPPDDVTTSSAFNDNVCIVMMALDKLSGLLNH